MSTEPQTTESQLYHKISVRPLTPTIGAEISGVDLRDPIEPETLRELRTALREHLVIFLRGQDLSDDSVLFT